MDDWCFLQGVRRRFCRFIALFPHVRSLLACRVCSGLRSIGRLLSCVSWRCAWFASTRYTRHARHAWQIACSILSVALSRSSSIGHCLLGIWGRSSKLLRRICGRLRRVFYSFAGRPFAAAHIGHTRKLAGSPLRVALCGCLNILHRVTCSIDSIGWVVSCSL